jgi:hypothetical protein
VTGTERSPALPGRGVERTNPSYFSFERGKPGGEGEGLYMPPPCRHRSTLYVKVARPWAGVLRWVPHGALGIEIVMCNAQKRLIMGKFTESTPCRSDFT